MNDFDPSGALATLHRRWRAFALAWARLPGNSRGAIWVLAAAASFSIMAVCVKYGGRTIPVWQLLVLRSLLALVILTPLLYRAGRGVWRTQRMRTHVLRSVLGLGGMTSFYFAAAHLDLALVTTLGFTRALFIIVLAVIFLGEVIKWRRSLATVAGFGGVLICMQPGAASFDPWTLAGLSFALFAASVTTAVKRLTFTESPLTILLFTYVLMGLIALGPALVVWRPLSLESWTVMILLALFSLLGQGFMVLGLRAGEVTALAPVEYTRLLFAALFGYVAFAEVPAFTTWIGAAVIITSTLYITIREARAGRQ